MEGNIYQEVELSRLRPSPANRRKRFSGPKFDELVASIREKGVIEPILARPIEGDMLEIVAGERRYRASLAVAEAGGNLNGQKIPALIRELSDDDAFDMMCIENLHREDLTELEEAEQFKAYLDKRGMEALPDLAERTGIDPRYIRRRVAVLGLPKKTLKAWEAGDLKYGHLEQLSRLKDKKEIAARTARIIDFRGAYSVRCLRDDINSQAPDLKHAKFDLEKAGCPGCQQNSDMQKALFEPEDLKGAHCLNPKCFKQHQNNWLIANWKKTGYRRQHKTNGFRFEGDISWNDYESFYSDKVRKKCLECPSFITVLNLGGTASIGKACIGDKSCFNATQRTASKGSDSEVSGPATRTPPAWHGEYFRELFLKEQLPMRLQDIPVDDVVSARIMLFGLLKSNSDLHAWFARRHDRMPADRDEDQDHWFHLGNKEIWEIVSGMTYDQLTFVLQEASIKVVMQDQYDADSRRAIAEHIGISLQEEWRITDEYLNKKTISEILQIAEEFKVFEQPSAKTFLYETLLKKRGNFKSCKKAELKRIFLESGVDLVGVVPAEILNERV